MELIWRATADFRVQATGPRHAWYWGRGYDSDTLVIPADTRFATPTLAWHPRPAGGYVYVTGDEPAELWVKWPLLDPVGTLEVGAIIAVLASSSGITPPISRAPDAGS